MNTDTAYCLNLLIFSALLGLIPAAIAHNKGKDFFGWWVFGAALFIVALPAAILARTEVDALEMRQLKQGNLRKCPFCSELIKRDAIVCKHCGRELPPLQSEELIAVKGLIACPNCGKNIPKGAIDCVHCGVEVINLVR